jgi:hypothetical protein
MFYDKIIIGAGFYGLYSALSLARAGQKVLVLEYEDKPFKRATYINQARIHNGYHYPRSYSTAAKSANYFERFRGDYQYCINNTFEKVYATVTNLSWTNSRQFCKFCNNTGIPCDVISPNKYFKPDLCDGAFITEESVFDAEILCKHLMKDIEETGNVDFLFNSRISAVEKDADRYIINTEDGASFRAPFVLNATYASVNQLLSKFGFEPFNIKYELCEIILCNVSERLKNLGITVMDGPFFSIMPFGTTPYHSLTSVTFTPHVTSYSSLPAFLCQKNAGSYCSPGQLGNCNDCIAKPKSAWDYMSKLAKKYLKDEFSFHYAGSLFSIKPILKSSEIDDSRPTVIKKFSERPTFISVLSGKINTVYDLDEVLKYEC